MISQAGSGFIQLAKTRIAPTPSGYLHLGNIYSFVVTLALAQTTGARLLLRIDDMDRERAAPRFIQDIFETLNFLGLPRNEGPTGVTDFETKWAQPHRLQLYNQALQTLLAGSHVFACTCSRTDILKQSADGSYPGTCRHKKLPLDLLGSALRMKTPASVDIQLQTLNGLQQIQELPATVRDFVVRKKDGSPAYQLCSLVDDIHFGIDLVVRGMDLFPSTLAQWWLSTLLPPNRFAETVFVHHPLLTDEGGNKLSKSAGHTSVYSLRKQGWSREEVFALLGKMAGAKEPVGNWQTLAEIIKRDYVRKASH